MRLLSSLKEADAFGLSNTCYSIITFRQMQTSHVPTITQKTCMNKNNISIENVICGLKKHLFHIAHVNIFQKIITNIALPKRLAIKVDFDVVKYVIKLLKVIRPDKCTT